MMTRDAKIGLLVGLAFILIVGILLSEHVTSTTTPGQAPLAIAGDRVRQATHAPIPPIQQLAKATIDPNPLPNSAVATRDQLDAPPIMPPTARIELGRPSDGQIQVIRVDAPQSNTQPTDAIAQAIAVQPAAPLVNQQPMQMLGSPNGETVGTQLVEKIDPRLPQDLAAFAKANGAELVALGGTQNAVKPQSTQAEIPNGARVREYIAQPGDSLSRMASRLLGANTPANCQAIVALNASLQKDSNRVIVGAKYLVPSDAWAAALRMGEEPVVPAKPTAVDEKAVLASTATVFYTVKAGDSLWKIAEREVGVRGAVAKIKQLNPEAFADSETVKVGMKLKLPAKTSGKVKAEG